MIDLSDGCSVDESLIAEIKVSHDQDFITVITRNGIGHVHEPKLGESVHVAIIRILEAASGIRVILGGEVTLKEIVGERDQPNTTISDLVGILEKHLTVTDEWGGCKLASWQWGSNVMIDGIESAADEIIDRYGVTR